MINAARKWPACGALEPHRQFYLRKGKPGGHCGPRTNENVVLCCRALDEMKSNLDVDELVRLSRVIVELHEKRSQAHG